MANRNALAYHVVEAKKDVTSGQLFFLVRRNGRAGLKLE